MPRNSGGTYTLPTGNPVVAGSTIEATWANNTLSDIATELTGSLSRAGEGGMTAALRVVDGTLSGPGLAFVDDVNTGLYRNTTDEFTAVAGGAASLKFTATGAVGAITSSSATITGGSINGTAIGGSTAAAGAFTTLTASSTATLNTLASSGATITGGTINNAAIGATTASTGAFTTLTASSTATVNTLASSGATITGGSINATTIGGTTRAAGSFTTLDANGNTTLGDATSDTVTFNARAASDLVPSTTNTRSLGSASLLWANAYATAFTEATFPVVSQTDIGTAPNEVPLNQYLGSYAYLDADNISYADAGTNGVAQNLAVNKASVVTISADTTLTTTVSKPGSTAFVIVITSGSTTRTVTFGTGFKATGTLATGATAARRFVLQFVSDGTNLLEVSRTTAITY
jgi:hypothetical protein